MTTHQDRSARPPTSPGPTRHNHPLRPRSRIAHQVVTSGDGQPSGAPAAGSLMSARTARDHLRSGCRPGLARTAWPAHHLRHHPGRAGLRRQALASLNGRVTLAGPCFIGAHLRNSHLERVRLPTTPPSSAPTTGAGKDGPRRYFLDHGARCRRRLPAAPTPEPVSASCRGQDGTSPRGNPRLPRSVCYKG